VSGIIVIKDAEIAFERYLLGNTPATKCVSMSVVNSKMATLVGLHKDGSIDNIDDTVTRFVISIKRSLVSDCSEKIQLFLWD
jgi:hypothetical protein